jgi:hypothetical protein
MEHMPAQPPDHDNDTYSPIVPMGVAADCNDEDPAIHPGAVDIAGDGIDQDCDGVDGAADGGVGDDGGGS